MQHLNARALCRRAVAVDIMRMRITRTHGGLGARASPCVGARVGRGDKMASSDGMCKCSSLFKDPRILPCLHTFCLQCLAKAAEIQGAKDSLKCPTCDESVSLPEGGVACLPVDLRKAEEAEIAGYGKKLEMGEEACGVCFRTDSGPAVSFCINCCEFLCKVCVEHHRSARKTHKHEIVTMGGTSKEECKGNSERALVGKCQKPPMPCSVHDDEILKFYCEECEKLICRDCMELDHNGHRSRCNRVEAVAVKAMQGLKSQASECENIVALLNNSITQCKESMKQADSRKEEVDSIIVKSLNQVRDALLAQSKELLLGKTTCLKMQVAELERVRDAILHVSDSVKTSELYTPSQQLATKKVVAERLTQVLQQFRDTTIVPLASTLFVSKLADQGVLSEIIAMGQISGGCDPASSTCDMGYIPRVVIGKERAVKVTARTRSGEVFPYGGEMVTSELSFLGTEKSIVHGETTDDGNGIYSISFTTRSAGAHELKVEICGHPVKGSPFALTSREPHKIGSDPTSFATRTKPFDVAFTSDGSRVVAEYGSHTVTLYSVTGKRIHTFGVAGTASSSASRFHYPSGVAVSGDVIYVADSYNNCIKKINITKSQVVSNFGELGSGDGQLSRPQSVRTDPYGKVFVADKKNNRVQVFQADGTFAYAITGDLQNKESNFKSPWGLAFDSRGHLHISAHSSNCIKVFTPEGAYIETYGSGTVVRPGGIAIDEEGCVVIADYGHNNELWVYRQHNQDVRKYYASSPGGIACDANGVFWITECENSRVVNLDYVEQQTLADDL